MKVWKAVSPNICCFLLAFVSLPGAHALAAGQEKKSAPVSTIPAQTQQIDASDLLPSYAIKPSGVALPADVPAGKYRRIIMPYPNWTLICDENLKEKKRVCNISQQIVDRTGSVAFSWSLAGTGDGQPVMILRTSATAGKGATINLSFLDKGKPIRVATDACDMKVCVAMLTVGPRMRNYIGKGANVEVSFSLNNPEPNQPSKVVIKTTLDGLSMALAAI
ncbi:Invasion associated locus B family protein [Agrobacterium rhizogenes]|nr:Invasion associated locus B family protein [Rhizobium rhizogenes]NTH66592.1 Invasion associated locus B family protein [Rhizobium rhizogenes]